MVAVVEQLGGAFGESGLLVLPCVAAHLIQVKFFIVSICHGFGQLISSLLFHVDYNGLLPRKFLAAKGCCFQQCEGSLMLKHVLLPDSFCMLYINLLFADVSVDYCIGNKIFQLIGQSDSDRQGFRCSGNLCSYSSCVIINSKPSQIR